MNGYQSDMARVLFAGDPKSVNQAKKDVTAGMTNIYETCLSLLRTENACSIQDIHLAAVRAISSLLLELGVIKSSTLETVVEQKLYFKYFPHYVGHYIGLDNNDTPTISCNTPLAPGVTFCIEPGLYFDGSDEVPEDLRHFGVRIEDTLLYVNNKTVDVLTKDTPL